MCIAAMLHDNTVDMRLRFKTNRLNVQGTDDLRLWNSCKDNIQSFCKPSTQC